METFGEILKYLGGAAGIGAILTAIIALIRYRRKDTADAKKVEAEARQIETETSIMRKNAVSESQTAEIARLEQRVNYLWDEHTKTLKSLQSAESDNKKLRDQYHGLLSEYNALKEENKELTDRVAALEDEVRLLRAG